MRPKMISCNSSCVEEYGYDEENHELYITFVNNGKTYVYSGVDPDIFESLDSAGSKGTYFQGNIKDKYSFRKD